MSIRTFLTQVYNNWKALDDELLQTTRRQAQAINRDEEFHCDRVPGAKGCGADNDGDAE